MRISCIVLLVIAAPLRADQFEHYTNPVLQKAVEDGKHVKEVKELTAEVLGEHANVLTDSTATFVIAVTNDRRYCKLLVTPARQRVGMDKQFPMLLVEKFVTYKEGTEKTVKASGQTLHLYGGSRFQMDLGQVVPEKIGGDLLVVEGEKDPLSVVGKPIDKAKLYILTEPIPGVQPKKGNKLVVGEQFEIRYFNGTYKLSSDGRRSGSLKLEVNESGEVTGSFYSDRDGQKYDVEGKVGNPRHAISFTIKYPQVKEHFTGYLFTANGKVLAGTAKIQEREGAFSAERIEE